MKSHRYPAPGFVCFLVNEVEDLIICLRAIFVLFCELSHHVLYPFFKLDLWYFLIHFQFFKKLILFLKYVLKCIFLDLIICLLILFIIFFM